MDALYVITGLRIVGKTRLADLLQKEFGYDKAMIVNRMDDLITDESSAFPVLIADLPDKSDEITECQGRKIIRINIQQQMNTSSDRILYVLTGAENKMLARVLASGFKKDEATIVHSMQEYMMEEYQVEPNEAYRVLIADFPENEMGFGRITLRTIIRIVVSTQLIIV
jgi:broad-specificity NMP kinase